MAEERRALRIAYDPRSIRSVARRSQVWVAAQAATTEQSVRDFEAGFLVSEAIRRKLEPVYEQLAREVEIRFAP